MTRHDAVLAACRQARLACPELALAHSVRKDEALSILARLLRRRKNEIEHENEKDRTAAQRAGASETTISRLRLDADGAESLAVFVETLLRQSDPVGRTDILRERKPGLSVMRRRVPLGVLGFLSDRRPDQLAVLFALALKSGNALLCHGGPNLLHSHRVLNDIFAEALRAAELPAASFQSLPGFDRDGLEDFLRIPKAADLVFCLCRPEVEKWAEERARMPLFFPPSGARHVYVHADADPVRAVEIVSEIGRVGPWLDETAPVLLLDRQLDPALQKRCAAAAAEAGLSLAGARGTRRLKGDIAPFDGDWSRGAGPDCVLLGLVDGLDGALEHVARHGSRSVEIIVSENYDAQQRFIGEADAGLVLANAAFGDLPRSEPDLAAVFSGRKLHGYGPLSAKDLTVAKTAAITRR